MVNGLMYCITTCTCIWCNSKKKENNPSNQHKQQARKATPHDNWIGTNTVKNKISESPGTGSNISAARNNGCTISLGGTSQKVPILEAVLVVVFWFSHQSFYFLNYACTGIRIVNLQALYHNQINFFVKSEH